MRPSEQHKKIANEIASRLPLSKDQYLGADKALLEQLGYEVAGNQAESNSQDYYPAGNVGIYKPQEENGQTTYTRDVNFKERWSFFADLPAIPAKGDKKRVVFLGESVARGFLLDPDYTPAMVLEKLLNANTSGAGYEVIDLAETNLEMRGIRHRFTQCLDLQPDLIIFLAGNNWGTDYINTVASDQGTFNTVSEALNAAKNIGEIKPVLEGVFEGLVTNFMEYVGNTAGAKNIPVIMAIPEFNLVDCRSTPGERVVTNLAEDGIAKWVAARDAAEKAWGQKDLNATATAAQTMIDLDPSHPLGFEMLADVKMAQGDHDAARELFELGRDTAIFCRSNSKPRTYQVIRKTMLEKAGAANISIVDLPEVFKAHLGGKVPGRELFLDYCHFTVRGIQVAMEATAASVMQIMGEEDSKTLKASDVKAAPATLAMGHLFAAIHNMHWGQSYDILKHHSQESVKASKDIAKTMVYYTDMISRSVSNNLTKSLEMILTNNTQIDRYGHALMHPMDLKTMELDLVNGMVDALKGAGINLEKFITELRINEHGIEGRNVNLMRSFYHATSYDEYQGVRPAFLQARDSRSTFFIVGKAGDAADLSLSFRIPGEADANSHVEFSFNGSMVSAVNTKKGWQRHSFTIPGKLMKDGVNHLVIHWPVPAQVDKKATAGTGSLLDAVYYVFGEISQFTAMGVKEPVLEQAAVQ